MSRGSTINRKQRRNRGLPAENSQKLLAAVAGLGQILDLLSQLPTETDFTKLIKEMASKSIERVGFKWTAKKETKNV